MAVALEHLHHNTDPSFVQQVTSENYENMSPSQLKDAAQQFKDKLQTVSGSSPEASQLASIDPTNATPQQVAQMHGFLLKNHPELMRDVLIAGGAIAVGALAAFAAKRYLAHHGR